jgi:hypothetical protein
MKEGDYEGFLMQEAMPKTRGNRLDAPKCRPTSKLKKKIGMMASAYVFVRTNVTVCTEQDGASFWW